MAGAIADQLLKPNARLQVKNILNGPEPTANPNAPKKLATPASLTLKQAGPWADCVKSVVLFATDSKFHY